ncbi:MAG TPA: hypothetical protein VL572_09000, partial [Pyrinomonadaceae bacterium]|nr:hypothetical protein [Pyrinomonadaceae bacterium]
MNIKQITSVALIILSVFFTVRAQVPLCEKPTATTRPEAGDYGSVGQFTVTRRTIMHPDATVPAPISVFLPSAASTTNRVPVIFFTHANLSHDFRFYEGLLNQLASNGYIVVFAPTGSAIPHLTRYQQYWTGFQLAVQQYSNVMDTTRVGFAGHSIGAGAVPEMATLGVAQGWGANGLFLMTMASWYSWGADYSTIPATAKLVVQVYWDDLNSQHSISENDIWNRLPQITERRWQVIREAKSTCRLVAGHGVPFLPPANVENALDYWGVWRRLHALSEYTFTGNTDAGKVAFGDDAFMGDWQDGSSLTVTPME